MTEKRPPYNIPDTYLRHIETKCGTSSDNWARVEDTENESLQSEPLDVNAHYETTGRLVKLLSMKYCYFCFEYVIQHSTA